MRSYFDYVKVSSMVTISLVMSRLRNTILVLTRYSYDFVMTFSLIYLAIYIDIENRLEKDELNNG